MHAIEKIMLPVGLARVRVSVPRVPVSLTASVVPKHSDRGRRSLRRFDRLEVLVSTSAAGEFRADRGDELNGARLLELAGSEVACRSGKMVDVMSSELRKTASGGVGGHRSSSSTSRESRV